MVGVGGDRHPSPVMCHKGCPSTLCYKDTNIVSNFRFVLFQIDAILKAFTYYGSCVDADAIEQLKGEPLKKLIRDMNSWSITDKNWDEKTWNFIETMVKIHHNVGIGTLFTLFVAPDKTNSSVNIIKVCYVFVINS